MSTRKVMMLYGERLGTFSKRIPESKRAEIEAEWTLLMKKYEKPTLVEIEVSEKPNALDNSEVVFNTKPPDWAKKHKQAFHSESTFVVGTMEDGKIKFTPTTEESYNSEKKSIGLVDEPSQFVKPKPIKEPTLVTDKLYNTVKVKNIGGYGGLLKDEFSDKHYWKGDDGWFEFDSLQHITEYLTIKKP